VIVSSGPIGAAPCDTHGSTSTLTGSFTNYLADGVQVTSCGCTDLGVHKIQLVK